MNDVGTGRRNRAKHYNTPGHVHFLTFSTYQRLPLLTNDLWRTLLARHVRDTCDEQAFALWAYVFMPEHVHLLVKPSHEVYDISRFYGKIKKSFTDDIVPILERSDSPLAERLWVRERPGKWCYRVWQEGGGYDLNITSLEVAEGKAKYCHNNAVTRGLVKMPGDWRWSSFRWLILGEREGAPLRVNEWSGWELLGTDDSLDKRLPFCKVVGNEKA